MSGTGIFTFLEKLGIGKNGANSVGWLKANGTTGLVIRNGDDSDDGSLKVGTLEVSGSIIGGSDEMGGRLTLTTGVPVTITDVSAAATLYYTPYLHNRIQLYNSTLSAWQSYIFAEVSISLSGLTAARPYDVFIYDNAGTITLELVAWTNSTTRATVLAKQDGRYVKSGAANRRYVGTIQIAATGQCEDSVTNRLVQNYYHRRLRRMRIVNATAHTYATATVRPWNNDATVRVAWVQGVQEDPAQFFLQTRVDMVATSGLVQANVGINTTSANSLDGDQFINQAVGALNIAANGSSYGALGSNYAQIVETGVVSNSPTFQVARLNGYIWG